MQHLLTELTPLVKDYGMWVVFFGMLVEGTSIIIISGILCYLGMLPLVDTIIVAIIGAVIGDQFWYFVGNKYAKIILNKLPSFQPKVEKLEPTVKTKGYLLSFSGRFIYGVSILFPLTLGLYQYPYKKFTLFDTLGIMLWSLIGVTLGYVLGTGAEHYFGKIEKVWHFILIICIIFLVILMIKQYMKKKKNPIVD